MALLTTSRYASEETRRAARKLAASPGSRFVARGKKTVAELAALARKEGFERVDIMEERRGKPASVSSMEILPSGKWRWVSGTHES